MNIEQQPLMVTIRCLTYNHEPYIRECLEGFVMQQTNFRFEAIVHDDASTDGTAAIVREYAEKYPDIIKPIYQTENQYSKRDGSIRRIMNEHTRGKYIALCEGDDYWIDPLKLQKQVDFLEANEEYGMVCTDSVKLIQTYGDYINGNSEDSISYENLLLRNKIYTATVVFRIDIYEEYNLQVTRSNTWLMGDYPMWLFMAYNNQIGYIKSITAVYRILPESAAHSQSKINTGSFIVSALSIFVYYITNFPIKDKNIERYIIQRRYCSLVKGIFFKRLYRIIPDVVSHFEVVSDKMSMPLRCIHYLIRIFSCVVSSFKQISW